MLPAVFKQAQHRIASDALRIVGIIPEYLEGRSVEAVQTISGPEPHKAFLILGDAGNGIARDAIVHLIVTEIIRLCGKRICPATGKEYYQNPSQ